MTNFYKETSLLDNKWKIIETNQRQVISLSQKYDTSLLISQLLINRNIEVEEIDNFFHPNFNANLPNPFILKDMEKSIERMILNIIDNKKIGIIADYDVDGSTSAAVLCNFLSTINCKFSIKIPKRLDEGYGPNNRIMNEFIDENIDLVLLLDCGTTSFDVLNNNMYQNIDIIVIDHHISENRFPSIYSIVNPNRYDEKSALKNLATVGLTFLLIMGLRKKLRDKNFFKKIKEPNLLNNLDLVALGTVCDVVNLDVYNRNFVKKGLEIIKKRTHKGIAKIIDNSSIRYTPTSRDLGFIVGPQLNAASRMDDSTLSSKILITKNLNEIDNISKKLSLLNEKRKLIENQVFEEALKQAEIQNNDKFLLVHGFAWHQGILGIIASRLVEKFNKPTFVISTNKKFGIGSARSIENIDIGNIIINAKNSNILISGGGHKMAAGLKIDINLINKFYEYLKSIYSNYNDSIFDKIDVYDIKISINELNSDLLKQLELFEPFGKGNQEPKFIVYGFKILTLKEIKNKHLLLIIKSDLGKQIKAICFNCIGTKLGENLINYKNSQFEFGCTIKKDDFQGNSEPQIIIKDAIIVN